jgi:trimethylamine---corrinoid protein Co-methyltransferase
MRPVLSLIDQELIQRIVHEGFEVLAHVGVIVESKEAVDLLRDAGCGVKNDRILIPQTVVEKSLTTVPARISLFDRSGRLAMDLQGDNVHFDPGSAALTILDWPSQRQRKPVTRDLMQFSRLTDALPHLAAQSTGLISSDVPGQIADRYRLFIALQNSTKPVVTGTFAVEAFPVMRELLTAVRGSSRKLAQQPLAIFDCCPSPPLKWSHLTCQALMDCARAGIPAEFVSMPLTGGTAPVTLTGALVQHTAETLSGVVIGQLAQPGAPLIYGGSPAAMDLRTGTTPMGAIETMMIDCSYARIGKYLNMPTHAYMALSDAKILDAQAGLETGIGAILAALSGINVISGPGMLDFESCQCLEKLIVDNEICGMALRLLRGVEAREERMAEDLFGDLSLGDHFLTSPTTLKWARREIQFPGDVIDRLNYESRQRMGEWSTGERAHRRVQEILTNHHPEPLDPQLQSELARIMLADAKKYGMTALPDSTI